MAVAVIVGLAFLLRLGAGLLRGPHFDHGYSFYADIARTFLSGAGLCFEPGVDCAVRMPVYPLLIAPFVAWGGYEWLVVMQAMIGAALPAALFAMATHAFDRRVALLAALLAALNPYAIVHDSALQDTVVLNTLVAVGVWLLVRAAASHRLKIAAAAGVVLALAILTNARIAPFVGLATVWLAWGDGVRNGIRYRLTAAALTPMIILVGLWIGRNAMVVGSPVLTTEAGASLWFAHNDVTMTILPHGSIDDVGAIAWERVDPEMRNRIDAAADDPVQQDRLYAALAWSYVRADPWRTVRDAAYRAALSFSGWLSPARSWTVQLGYAAWAVPLNVLALVGLVQAFRKHRMHWLLMMAFASVAIMSAVFWSHTSHRSYVHGFKILYASSVILSLRQRGDRAASRLT